MCDGFCAGMNPLLGDRKEGDGVQGYDNNEREKAIAKVTEAANGEFAIARSQTPGP